MKHELATLALWLAAAAATFYFVQGSSAFRYLGPLYFVCMVGSIYILRAAKRKR